MLRSMPLLPLTGVYFALLYHIFEKYIKTIHEYYFWNPHLSGLVYPDNTLTGEGERAKGCIQNGIALAGGGTLLALPLPLVIGALKLLSEPTGCGGIVEWDYADSVGGSKEIIGIFS